jgi:chromosome segregation ATPase
MSENVSKELFQAEIRNLKEAQLNISIDMKQISEAVTDLQISVEVMNSKFDHIYKSLESITKSFEKHNEIHARTVAKVNDIYADLESIKKYPVYTKWTLGIILSIGGLWTFLKNQF